MRFIEFKTIKSILFPLFLLACVSCDYWKPKDSKTAEEAQEEFHSNPDTTKYRLKVQGKVVEITDGDTFVLLDENKSQVKIRLHEIDAPETNKKQRYSKQARKALSDLVLGKTVHVYHKIGTNGNNWNRTIGVAFVNELNVNKEMIRQGFAWHSKQYSFGYSLDSIELDSLERNARLNKIGLWEDENPVAPWIIRKQSKSN